ncbi:hypothetical protein BDQ17DRAFT_1360692 [Cyathus striatus]|nr:hypothetical protein BDQ17DRAFT_1360692 [Cyathus striatus]
MESLAQTILVLLEHMQNVTYLHVASLALWVFEHLITLDKEVTYIWGSSHWSVVKVLYVFVRYSTYVDATLNIVVQCFPSLSSKTCKSIYYAIIWFLVTGMTAAEIILTLRVWAVWQKTKIITIVLTLYFIGTLVPVWVNDGILGRSLTFNLQDLLHVGGCLATSGRIALEASTWGLLLAYDTIMMLLMLPPAYDAFRRGGKSTMASTVIRDGIIYYIYLFVVSLVNMVVLLKLSPDYFSLLAILGRVIHSALSCRVVLNIREQGWANHRLHSTTITGV